MNDRVFLDTNVLIYAYSTDDVVKKQQALTICAIDDVWISTQVLSEFTNIARRKMGVSWADLALLVEEMTTNFPIHSNDSQTIKQAVRLAERYQLSWYDSLIVSAALESSCAILYSEDLNNSQIIESKLTIINPFTD